MNGWFPRINRVNAVISGNSGIWHTAGGTSLQLAPFGTTPCWAGLAPVFNINDGRTMFNGQILPTAYNVYRGRDDGYWAGATDSGTGAVTLYQQSVLATTIPTATCPRLGGGRFAYLLPFQHTQRQLVVDFQVRASGNLANIAISADGTVLVYQTATGTYTRKVWTEDGKDISVRNNEDPQAAFLGPDGPWIVTVTPDFGVLVRPAFSSIGYRLTDVLHGLDARMVGAQLRIVGASDHGELRDVWIDFNQPRQDLRQH